MSVGAVGAVSSGGGAAAAGAGRVSHGGGVSKAGASAGVTPAGNSGGNKSISMGDGNMVGNSQTQNITTHNHFNMGSQDFCALHNMSNGSQAGGVQAMQGGEQMSMEDMMKLMMMMIMMKLMEKMMEALGGGQGGGAAMAGG
tara:strand:- start:33125 stop:33550 length:426 start_codon:yes stop_codon:yes gene_type:complete